MDVLESTLAAFDHPEMAMNAARFASASSSLFASHGAVDWSRRLESSAVGLSMAAVGLDNSEIPNSGASIALPEDDTLTMVGMIATGAVEDELMLREMVDAAQAGTPRPGFDPAPAWLTVIESDPEMIIATGIAFDAVRSITDAAYVPMTAAGRSVLEIFPQLRAAPEAAPGVAP